MRPPVLESIAVANRLELFWLGGDSSMAYVRRPSDSHLSPPKSKRGSERRTFLVPCSRSKSSIHPAPAYCSYWNFRYATKRPSGDQTGDASSPPSESEISFRCSAPFARINQISCPVSANPAPLRNTI